MDEIIRWGIIGTGNIAGQFSRGLRDCAGARLVAVGSRSMDKAKQFGREFGITRCHESYAALAEDTEVDVVYVATPHTLHRDNTIMCLEAGKAVLCEKPLAVNARQASEMVDFARRKGKFLMEAMWTRFLPPMVEVHRLVADGIVGNIRIIAADLGFALPKDPAGRLFNPHLAGGCLLEVGVYPISLATMLLGAPKNIVGQATMSTTGVDEQDAISLGYPRADGYGYRQDVFQDLESRT